MGLVLLVVAAYWQVDENGFVRFDDPEYVTENPVVGRGLTAQGIAWAFMRFNEPYWHPLTWLSHMTDVEMFGLDPGWHHRVSVAWHALNTLLFFLVLRAATGAMWRSAFAASLFAVHPLRVESVAWIAERKDLLSTFFWLLAMAAYVGWARRPKPERYVGVVLAFALGLMCKPMVVTLPLVLLLLDVWPLKRVDPGALSFGRIASLVKEKIPLFLLAAASSVSALVAEVVGGTAHFSLESLPIAMRIANALVSYVAYLGKLVWPASLSVFYPHPAGLPGGIPTWWIVSSIAVLAGGTGLAVFQWRRRPFLAVGWLWYLLTLVPVIGLVQVGLQGMADRFTYLPAMGIFIALAWAIPAPGASRLWRSTLTTAAIAVVVLAAWWTYVQTGYWRDGRTLFRHASQVVPDSSLVWTNLGTEYFHSGELVPALQAFERAVRLRPDEADVWLNLAMAHGALGQHAEAVEGFQQVVRLQPNDEVAWFNLGIAYALLHQSARVAEVVDRLRRTNPAKAQELFQRARELEAAVLPRGSR